MGKVDVTGRRRWRRWVFIGLSVLLVLVVFAWWRLWQGGVGVGPAKADVSKIESRDNFSAVSSTSNGHGHRLAVRDVVILCDDSHPLLVRAGQVVRDKLANFPAVKSVTYLAPGERLPAGERLPDLLIRMKLPRIEEHSSPISRTLEASVAIQASTGLQDSSHSYSDDLTPPIVHLTWNGDLEHNSTSIGDGVGADRYRLTGPHIGERIAKEITETLTKLNKKHGSLGTLPPAFWGVYRPPSADLAAIAQTSAPPLLSGCGLLRHNESLWEFGDPREAKLVLEEVQGAMKERGWTGNDLDVAGAYLRMNKGPAILSVYAQRERLTPGSYTTSRPAERKYAIHYVERFAHKELEEALRPMLANGDANLLMSFDGMLGPELRAKLIEQLEATPVASAHAYVLLARHYQRNEPAKSAAYLAKADVLNMLTSDDSDFRGQVDEIAKALKLPTPFNTKLTPKLMAEMQIPQIDAKTPLKKTVAADEPVVGFMLSGKGEVYLVCARVTPAVESKDSPYEVVQTIASPMGKSMGRGGGSTGSNGRWSASRSSGFNSVRAEIDAREQDAGRFEIVIKVGGE